MRAFIESIFGPDRELPRWLRCVLWASLAVLVIAYFSAAVEHGKTQNTIYDRNDQRVYMDYARNMRETRYDVFVTRMRMPMFMGLLSLAATPQQSDEDFFPVAQKFSIGLSLVCLGALFFALRRWLGTGIGWCFVLTAAGQVYLYRAPYVQPELTLTTIITITVAWLAYTLRNPKWQNALVTGLLLCAWFFTKASAQIALGLFGAFLGLKWLLASHGKKMPFIVCGLVTLAAYLVPMSPYLWTSYKLFGDPFYNVQGKYYMWCNESDNETVDRKQDEKHMLQKAGLDRNLDILMDIPKLNNTEFRAKYKDLNVDPDALRKLVQNLPSAGRYWREHSWKEVEQRLSNGMRLMFRAAFNEYTALYFMIAVWAGIALWAMALHWPEALAGLLRWRWELFFVTVLVASFAYLFGWFVPLKAGPRLINSVALVPVFFAAALTHHLLRGKTTRVLGSELSVEKLFVFAFVIGWAVLTIFDVPPNLQQEYFGG